jgi:hypothetical protein
MNTHHSFSSRRSGGVFVAGTSGWNIGLAYYLSQSLFGPVRTSTAENPRSLVAIETAQSSREIAMRAGPGHPAVKLPHEYGLILPECDVHALADECMRHPAMRRYGEKLLKLRNGTTGNGVGASPLTALVAGLAALQQIDRVVEDAILMQRDRARIDAQQGHGNRFTLDGGSVQILAGNLAGGTFPGLFLLLAQRIQHFALKHLGGQCQIILFALTPSASSGGDIVTAKGNFAVAIRQAMLAMHQPEKIVFHGFNGEELRANAGLIQRIVPWSPSTGRLSLSNREEICAQMALGAGLLLDTAYGAASESLFRDHEKEADDERYGARPFARMGISRWAIDHARDHALARAEGYRLVSEHLLRG